RRAINVRPGGGLDPYVLYTRPGTRTPTVTVRCLDERGRPRGRPVEDSDAETVEAGQSLIAVMGNSRGVDELPTLPGFAVPGNTQLSNLRVVKVRSGGSFSSDSGLPGKWYGYDAAEAIVLDTNDAS